MGVPERVSQGTSRHCAALVGGYASDIASLSARAPLLAQGTITFVDLDGDCLGVTNEHVIRGMLDRDKPATLYIGLSILYEVPRDSLIALSTRDSIDVPFDVAVMRLDRNAVLASGKEPAIPCERRLQVGEVGLAVGFPGSLREPLNDVVMAHRLGHVAATCGSSSERSVVLQETLGDDTPPISFGGMSGGGIFAIESEEQFSLVGITYEGRGFREADDAALAQDDVWVYGFPLTVSSLRRIIELAPYPG